MFKEQCRNKNSFRSRPLRCTVKRVEIFKNTFFTEHLRATASVRKGQLKQCKYIDTDYIYCITVRKLEILTFITVNKKLDGLSL